METRRFAAGSHSITAALGEPLGFAGYAVLSLLAAADLWVEFGLDPEQALRVSRYPADSALLDAAHQVASTVRDPDFRASRLFLVHVYRRHWHPAPPPQPETLGERLAALPDRDTRLAYLAHLSAVWSAPATANAAGLRALVPLALEDDTTLDIVLARWVASRAHALTPGEIEAMITDCERDLARGRPWDLGGQAPPDVSGHAPPRHRGQTPTDGR